MPPTVPEVRGAGPARRAQEHDLDLQASDGHGRASGARPLGRRSDQEGRQPECRGTLVERTNHYVILARMDGTDADAAWTRLPASSGVFLPVCGRV
jgi:hypothetical protein